MDGFDVIKSLNNKGNEVDKTVNSNNQPDNEGKEIKPKKPSPCIIKFKRNIKNFIKLNKALVPFYKRSAKILLVLFLAINALVFLKGGIEASVAKYHKTAKIYTSAANTVNFLYVMPLKKVFGWRTPLAVPFVHVRNFFAKHAIENIPEDDWEREQVWYITQFPEYTISVDQVMKSIGPRAMFFSGGHKDKVVKRLEKYPIKDLQILLKKTEELYSHIELFTSKKIRDENLKKYRLNLSNALAVAYMDDKGALLHLINKKKSKPWGFYTSEKEMNRLDNILNRYLELVEYSKEHEQEGYNTVMNDIKMNVGHHYMLLKYSSALLRRKLIDKTFSCNDELLKLYIDNYMILKNYQTGYRGRSKR